MVNETFFAWDQILHFTKSVVSWTWIEILLSWTVETALVEGRTALGLITLYSHAFFALQKQAKHKLCCFLIKRTLDRCYKWRYDGSSGMNRVCRVCLEWTPMNGTFRVSDNKKKTEGWPTKNFDIWWQNSATDMCCKTDCILVPKCKSPL